MTKVLQRRLTAAWLAGACLLAAPGARAGDTLRVSGTGSSLGALQELAGAFAKASPGDRVQVLPSVGSSGAIAAVAKGALDVGISGRPLQQAEEALGVVAVPYARTPFVVAVGPRAGIRGITAEELARIYRGETTAWPNGERVRLVMRPRADVDTALVRAISPELAAAVDTAYGRQGLLLAITNQECDELLARTPGAIGPTSLTQLSTGEKHLVPLAWGGVEPTLANLASGAYPLAKTLLVVTRAPSPPAVQRFLDFLASPAAARILERTGCLPLSTRTPRTGDGEDRR